MMHEQVKDAGRLIYSRRESSSAIAVLAPYIKCFRFCGKNESKPKLLIPRHLLYRVSARMFVVKRNFVV